LNTECNYGTSNMSQVACCFQVKTSCLLPLPHKTICIHDYAYAETSNYNLI